MSGNRHVQPTRHADRLRPPDIVYSSKGFDVLTSSPSCLVVSTSRDKELARDFKVVEWDGRICCEGGSEDGSERGGAGKRDEGSGQ